MSVHRGDARRSGVRPAADVDSDSPRFVARGQSVEETFVPDVDELPSPAGFGTEASTTQQATVLLDEYRVPDQTLAEVQEVSLSIEANGQARVSAPGVTYGPFTGATDVAVPLDGSRLTEGDLVRVFHQSTDGTSTTTKALLAALEV